MLNLNNVDMNELITYDEANEILKEAKRIYPQLNGLEIYTEESFSYCRDEYGHYVTIPPQYNKDEIADIGHKILSYINKEFDSNFALNLKTISINAFCHELGHCIVFANKKCNPEYEEDCDKQYEAFYDKAYNYRDTIDDLEYEIYCLIREEEDSHSYDDEEDEDIILDLEDLETACDDDQEKFDYQAQIDEYQNEIDSLMNELDNDYRHIISEYHADEFSAEFMNVYMRHIKQLFN